MSQSDLDNIAKKGLINHIRDPTVKYVQNLQLRWKMFAEHRYEDQTVMGVLKHMKSGLFLSFNAFTGESYTGYKLEKIIQKNNFIKYDKKKHLDRLKYSQKLDQFMMNLKKIFSN